MIKTHEVYYPLYQDKEKFILLVTGGRGCEIPTQEVIMADGSIKQIQYVQKGEFMMGDDGKPRKVLGTVNGHSQMYHVKQWGADDYYVNDAHILTLADSDGNVFDIPILAYLELFKYNKGFSGVVADLKTFEKHSVKIKVEPIGDGDWCGVFLDGNQRYLHPDGTVLHNSGKSFGTSTFIERLTFELNKITNELGEEKKIVHNILYSRYTMTSASISVIPEFMEKIEADGTQKYFYKTKSDIVNIKTGAHIMFRGIKTSSGNQTAKLKSIHGITTFVCDEAEEWRNENEFDTIMLSIRQKGIQNRIIIIMNPTDSNHFIYQKYIKDTHKEVVIDGVPVQISTHPNVLHIHTTYLDNYEHLSDQFKKEVEIMKEKNPDKYAHTVIGRWADVAEGAIFKNWSIIKEFPKECKKVALGADYGYTNDVSACVKVGILYNDLYIDEQFYESGMMLADLRREFKKACMQEDGTKLPIYSESADPRLVDELALSGLLIYPIDKSGMSILAGIEKIKDFDHIYVTERSYNVQEELRNYTWEKDKDGHLTNQPIDKFNHCFVGDTKVITSKGNKRIDNIECGDYVLTSQGFREVTKTFDQGIREVFKFRLLTNNGEVVVCATPDHKVKTNNGWKQLQQLEQGDLIYLAKSLMGKNIIGTATKDTSAEGVKDYILRFGNTTTEVFQRVITYTTKIVTKAITELKTLSYSLYTNICQCTHKNTLKTLSLESQQAKGLRRLENLLKNGMQVKREKSGIEIMELKLQQSKDKGNLYASCVEKNLYQSKKAVSAQTSVRQKQGIIAVLTMKLVNVKSVVMSLLSINMRKNDFAQKNVQESRCLNKSKGNLSMFLKLSAHVNDVGNHTQHYQMEEIDIVPNAEGMQQMSQRYAKCVGTSSQQENIHTQDFAVLSVLESVIVEEKWQEKTYDIEVKGEHEFFANGLLVHNCMDALRYYVLGKLLGKILKPKKIKGDLEIF